MSSSPFKDLFSGHAGCYACARPTYPAELFAWLAERSPGRALAWDCGTGNGQAAVGLAAFFDRVIATDGSASQLAHAVAHPRVTYGCMTAEEAELPSAGIDLITVAQALHWFRHDDFYATARRAARPGGLLAGWCYNLPRVSAEVDDVCDHLYVNVVGPYWAEGREHIDACYRTIPFPFDDIAAPDFCCVAQWQMDQYLAYLRSWSAVQAFMRVRGHDPLSDIAERLAAAWGDAADVKSVRWPIHMRVGRLNPA